MATQHSEAVVRSERFLRDLPASNQMLEPSAAQTLADFCANLKRSDIPDDVVNQARSCIIDTTGVAAFGAQFAWSQAVARYARAYGQSGACQLLGMSGVRLQAPYAALANGAFAHAFEQDSLRKPGAGVHPGAALFAPALALAQERGVSGERVLLAVIAGCEVMFRIGSASLHSSEQLGFHAPGLTGPYGASIAAGIVMGLNSAQLTHALGIAGSLSGGLLAFSQSLEGAEVKRLHLGRACESGVLAARLAEEGFAGPERVLEGRFGFLDAYCAERDASKLTAGLGTEWETRRICLKAYPCHVTAHTPIESLRLLMQTHEFRASEVAGITIHVSKKVLSHHDIRHPADIKQAQYSVPFCVALSLHRDPADPAVFEPNVIHDSAINQTCADIKLLPFADQVHRSAWASRLTIQLKNGNHLSRDTDQFAGCPEQPLSMTALEARFMKLTARCEVQSRKIWFDRLNEIEQIDNFAHMPDLA
jgi:2-methylcitrate dehydratase PrpD